MSYASTPTEYDGYRFRSYLEARWAAFFNALRVPYRYEPKLFNLGWCRYLPDFWLPKQKAWIEIKPTPHHVAKVDAKLRELATRTCAKVVLFCDDLHVPLSGWRYWPDGRCTRGYQLTDSDDSVQRALVASKRFLERLRGDEAVEVLNHQWLYGTGSLSEHRPTEVG